MARTKLSKRGIIFIALSIIVVIALALVGIFVLTGASSKSPTDLTLEFMNKYKNATSEVMNQVKYPYADKLDKTQMNTYKDLIRSQYRSMSYTISDETVGEVDAIIKVDFDVYDYASSYDKASSYLSLYGSDMSLEKQVNYKLKEMSNTKEKVTYSIEFKFYKLDGVWYMTDVTSADLSKLTGTF